MRADLRTTLRELCRQVGGPPKGAPNLLGLISGEHDELFKTQRETDIEHYDDELKDLNDALTDQKLISEQEFNEALREADPGPKQNARPISTRNTQEQASHLFDDLLERKG